MADPRMPLGLQNVPQQRRAQEFVERVLTTAEALLQEAGVDAFTMNRLAEAGGVSIGGIYRYFPDRLSLLTAVQERFLTRVEATYLKALTGKQDLEATLGAFLDCVARTFLDNARMISAFLTRRDEPLIAARGATSLRSMEQALVATCLQFKHEIAHGDVAEAARFIHSLAAGLMITLADDVSRGGDVGVWLTRVEEFKRLSLQYLTSGTAVAEAGQGRRAGRKGGRRPREKPSPPIRAHSR